MQAAAAAAETARPPPHTGWCHGAGDCGGVFLVLGRPKPPPPPSRPPRRIKRRAGRGRLPRGLSPPPPPPPPEGPGPRSAGCESESLFPDWLKPPAAAEPEACANPSFVVCRVLRHPARQCGADRASESLTASRTGSGKGCCPAGVNSRSEWPGSLAKESPSLPHSPCTPPPLLAPALISARSLSHSLSSLPPSRSLSLSLGATPATHTHLAQSPAPYSTPFLAVVAATAAAAPGQQQSLR